MAYPQRLLTDDETVLMDFRAHWRALLAPIVTTIVVVVLAVAILWLGDRQGWDVDLGIWVPLAALVLLLVAVVPAIVRWWFHQYVLTTERIIVRTGIVARSGTEIPLENINNVLFSQSAAERMLGYGDVIVESAGSMGQSRLTDIPDPEAFQSQVYRAREERTMALEGGPRGRDTVAQLESLAALHDAGKLTDAEFEGQKRRLLGG